LERQRQIFMVNSRSAFGNRYLAHRTTGVPLAPGTIWPNGHATVEANPIPLRMRVDDQLVKRIIKQVRVAAR
jgi:hypothetical protein